MIQQSCCLVFIQKSWKLRSTQKVYTNVYSLFLIIAKNLESYKSYGNRWMDKQTGFIHTM